MGTKYSTVSISGYNSAPPADDGTQTAANQVKWSTIKTKLPDPLKTAIEAINSQLVTYADFGIRQVSTSDTTTAADYMKTVEIAPGTSTSVTVSLGDAATMTAGYIVTVKNSSAINQTVGRATAGNTINGFAGNITIPAKEAVTFKVIGAETGYIIEATTGGVVYDAADPRKAVVWSASGVSSGSARVVTAPNANLTLPNASVQGRIPIATSVGVLGMAAALNKAIYGLTYANGTDAVNDLDIAAGGCMDATGAYWITTAALTKQSDATWAVGTAAGGLDTGVVGNNDYYIWAIARSDTGVTDILFSLSSTAPTMPANYDFKRLIGWFKRSGGAIVAFKTYETAGGGLELLWDAPRLDLDISNTLTTTEREDALSVPLNLSVVASINAYILDGTGGVGAYIHCPDTSDQAPSDTASPLSNVRTPAANQSGLNSFEVRTSATGTVASRGSVATVDQFRIVTVGFEWGRRN